MMTSLERFTRRLQGEPVDRPPNFDIMMTFAAHYIVQPLSNYYLDHRVLVEANLAVLQDFDLDIVQAISDPFREAADFGAQIAFPFDGLPLSRGPLLADPSDLSALRTPDPGSGRRMSDRLEAIRMFREQLGGEIPIMGWVEGALAEAADLRGVPSLLADLYDRPEWVEELLERCVGVAIAFAQAQVEAGADIIGLGDSVASLVSPKMYRRYALPYERRVFDAVRAAGAVARLHICGNTSRIVPDMAETGADIIDLDWMVDFGAAARVYGEDGPAVCGNFDPTAVMLQGSPQDVRRAVLECLRAGGSRCISAAGCEIPDGTPHENLRAQSRALAEYAAAVGAGASA
jgi:MtaA/CmuA family methyltransferase